MDHAGVSTRCKKQAAKIACWFFAALWFPDGSQKGLRKG